MPVLLVHDDSGLDPVSSLLRTRPQTDVEVVPLSAFLRRMGVQFDPAGGRLFRGPSAGELAPVTASRIIDRVSEVSLQTAQALAVGDAPEAQPAPAPAPAPAPTTSQVQQAYEQLVRDAAQLPPERQYSTLGRMLPLTNQWYAVREALPHLAIPVFKSGYGPEPVEDTGIERPIWKSPFDFYAWQPNAKPEGPIWDALVVGRPEGSPVLVYGPPDQLVTAVLGPSSPETRAILDAVHDQLVQDSALILRLFGFAIGEVLWFVSPSARVFAACSPLLYGCARQPDFEAVVDRYVGAVLAQVRA